MSTRTRIVLIYNKQLLSKGPRAIQELIQYTNAQRRLLKHKIAQVEGATKKDKLLNLAKQLPDKFSLILIQEPKGTRKNKSLYWKELQNKGEIF